MIDFRRDIDAALAGDETIPRDSVLLWIDSADDLSTLSKLYRITRECYYRIQPDLGKDTTCALIQRYLLKCIREGVADDEEIQDRWEAAESLHIWFRHLLEIGDHSAILLRAAHALTDLFLTNGEEVRDVIEMGFLEHALETAALRPYFEHWSSDARLSEAWGRALEWGKAHPDFTWGLLQQIRKIQQEK